MADHQKIHNIDTVR